MYVQYLLSTKSFKYFFQEAQKLFQNSFANCKQRLAILAKKLGSCVERARPYYDACKQAEEVD